MSLLRRLAAALPFVLFLPACTTSVFFQPLDREHWATPAQYGLPYEDVWFETEDDVRLHGWFLPAFGDAEGTIVFLHGNTEDIGSHLGEVAWMPAAGLNVFLFDYRGYGLSRGTPDLPHVLRDVDAALSHIAHRPDLGRGIIVYGQSLGGAMAPYALLHSSHRSQVRALILDSAFAGFDLIAREALGDFLFRRLSTVSALHELETYSPLTALAGLAPLPILIVHSEADRAVPVRHAALLYDAARAPKTFWQLSRGAHARTLRDQASREIREIWLRYALAALDGTVVAADSASTARKASISSRRRQASS